MDDLYVMERSISPWQRLLNCDLLLQVQLLFYRTCTPNTVFVEITDGRQGPLHIAQLRNCYYTFIQEMTAESEGTISEMALSVFSTWDSIKIFHLHNNGMLGGLCRQLETGGRAGLLRISFITAQRLPHEIELGWDSYISFCIAEIFLFQPYSILLKGTQA